MRAMRRLTNPERQALQIEIDRQLAMNVEKLRRAIEATVLWDIYQQFDCTVDDLIQFRKQFNKRMEELEERYEMHGEGEWLAEEQLRRIGIDLAEDPMLELRIKEGL